MLQSKKANLILALVLAIAFWLYVIGEIDPETSKVYRGVPITIKNEHALEEHGLSVAGLDRQAIAVTVSGNRSSVYKLRKDRLRVSVNVANAREGGNSIGIDVRVPRKIELQEQSAGKVNVAVEKRVNEKGNVEIAYTEKVKEGYEPEINNIRPKVVGIAGGKSQISKVKKLQAKISPKDIKEHETSIDAKIVPVDSKGEEVAGIEPAVDKVEVRAILLKTKTVPLGLKIKGKNAGKYERECAAPESVTIKGTATALKSIVSVRGGDIDVSEIKKDSQVKIVPILQDGIKLSGAGENLLLKVKVTKKADRKN